MEAAKVLLRANYSGIRTTASINSKQTATKMVLARQRLTSSVVAVVMVKSKGAVAGVGLPATEKTVYEDSSFDRLAIRYLSLRLQDASGMMNNKDGYESLVEAAIMISRNFNVEEQREVVIQAMRQALPNFIFPMAKILMPPSKFSRELFASFTTVFFPWLVGLCEVRESEFEGGPERNVVYMPKCRFLESTNCVGMCINLCKIPTEKFIEASFGMPVHMAPNFEEMTCEMTFGKRPSAEDDPALKQPCYQSLCIAKQNHGVNCSS